METYEDYTWTTRDGTKIKVGDMSTPHVINSIKMMRRSLDKWSKEEAAAWSCLSMFQGEMAQYYCEKDIDRLARIQEGLFLWISLLEKNLEWRTNNIKDRDFRWRQ